MVLVVFKLIFIKYSIIVFKKGRFVFGFFNDMVVFYVYLGVRIVLMF